MERCAASVARRAARAQQIPGAARDQDEQRGDRQGERRERRTLFQCGRLYLHRRLRLGGDADLKRVNPDRLGDVLELRRAEIGDGKIEPPLDLPVGLLGQADRARLADALQPRGDIDPVAHQIAVALLDHVAEMNADPEFDAALRRHAGVPLDGTALQLDGATHGVDHAAELDDVSVAGALDDPPVMRGDGGVDQIATQPPQPRQRAILVRAREPAVADHVGGEDRRDLSRFRHAAPSGVVSITQKRRDPRTCLSKAIRPRGWPRLIV